MRSVVTILDETEKRYKRSYFDSFDEYPYNGIEFKSIAGEYMHAGQRWNSSLSFLREEGSSSIRNTRSKK